MSSLRTSVILFCLACFSCLIFPVICFSQIHNHPKKKILLHEGWEFRRLGSDDWYPASVPGSVHTDLQACGRIPDPFYRSNEQGLQWIGKTDWEYSCEFQLSDNLLDYSNIELVFEGLDTYADVFVNGELILTADNMFRRWRMPCKKYLRVGLNSLRIRFESPINKILPIMENIPYRLPAGNDQGEKTSVYTRKAPYQFGWDWGPRFVTCGIWRPVYLEAWDWVRIDNVYLRQDGLSEESAQLTAAVEILSTKPAAVEISIGSENNSFVEARQDFKLKRGVNYVSIPLEINNPILWWPNGYGEQHLYSISTQVLLDGEQIDSTTTRIGLRSVELRQKSDQWGKSFEFVVNGIPIFAKGGNWIPADSFPSRMTPQRYRHLLGSCAAANMNMVRVWGGGIYEDTVFHEICDELGLMVWQDFMFACSMYPGDPEFLENVRSEAIDNVKRLRNHPCIVLWCGNNEVETAWFNWGWKERLPAGVWHDCEKIFHEILPEVCAVYDPSRPYWPSSPSSEGEDAPNSQQMGDTHYWDVWHGAKPFDDYESHLPRFCSEYGFQSFPMLKTVSSFALPEDHSIESPVMTAHQKHSRGNQLIREYMLRHYPEPKDFESFLYVSQVLQAEGIKIGAEHFRRIKPRCMGSLYWQINDCWPVASWSGIDYFGRWKALHYYAGRFYNGILVSPNEENGVIKVYVVSDITESIAARLDVKLMDFGGHVSKKFNSDIAIKPNSSEVVLEIEKAELTGGLPTKNSFLYCQLSVNGKVVSQNKLFFHPIKDLALPNPNIEVNVTRSNGEWFVCLSSDKFAKDVYLNTDILGAFFHDNFFDLIPGEEKLVKLTLPEGIEIENLSDMIQVVSLVDAFKPPGSERK